MPTIEMPGYELYYKVRGEGPVCLGIMGFGVDHRYWASQIAAITPTHRFVTFDNRGAGRSTGEAPTTIEEMAADAVAVLDHVGEQSCVVFGVSMGGAIAQRMALDHPDRVSALILALTFARPLEFMRRQHEVGRHLSRLGPERFVDATLLRMFTPRFFEIGSESVDRLVRSYLDAPGGRGLAEDDTLQAQLDALDKHDALDQLRSISIPALVIGAKLDMMVPYFASEEIAAAIPGARFESFETGHACFVEEMDAVNEVIHDFLAGLDAS